jgi:hypothetical protein
MGQLNRLALRTITTSKTPNDPTNTRRSRLIAAIDEQKLVLAAAERGESYSRDKTATARNAEGQRVKVTRKQLVRAWFFPKEDGWYVQPRYGARVLQIAGAHNAVYVKSRSEVAGVLDTLRAATAAGELDPQLARMTLRKRTEQ